MTHRWSVTNEAIAMRRTGRVRKPPLDALRALKRRLSDVVYRQMLTDAKRLKAGPGGRAGRL